MTMMRTANPALNKKTFAALEYSGTDTMTVQGVVDKTFILFLFVLTTAVYVWRLFFNSGTPQVVTPWMTGGLAGGLIFAFITIFNKQAAGITAIFEAKYPGIVIQAVSLTFGTLFSLLLLYTSGIIKAAKNFKLGVVSATGAIAVIYLLTIVLGFFGIRMPFIHESGLIGIGFSLFVVAIAALNLVLDFDFIENGSDRGAPEYMEWYASFGLMVTLVWLYIRNTAASCKVAEAKINI